MAGYNMAAAKKTLGAAGRYQHRHQPRHHAAVIVHRIDRGLHRFPGAYRYAQNQNVLSGDHRDEIVPEEELPEIRALLEKFAALSVRECQTCEYLRRIGLSKVQHVLDPSLLLDAEEWRRVAGCPVTEAGKGEEPPYLLVYSVERFNNDFIFSQARRIARERGLRMYVVCTTWPVKAKDYGFDKVYAMADVPTFLRLMAGASFVVASSFHGTAFALNFNKDFITISAGKYNIRMESLVRQFDIAHRIVETEEVSSASLRPIDYGEINRKLDRERGASLEFLRRAIKDNA